MMLGGIRNPFSRSAPAAMPRADLQDARQHAETSRAVQPQSEERSLTDDWLLSILGAVPSSSGVSVTAQNALRCPPVLNAVGLISEVLGTLPVKIYRRLDDGGKEVADDHPSYPLVHSDANPWTSAGQLRTQLTADALLSTATPSAGFAFVNRVGGRVVEFVRLDPNAVSVEPDERTGEPWFRVADKGTTRKLSYRDVLYIPAFHDESPVKLAKEAIALAIVLERHCATFFGKGGRPDGILSTDNKLGSETAKRVGTAWKAAFGGGQSGGTPVLEDGLKYQALSFSSVDQQLLELRQFQVLEIARAFRVPPVFVQSMAGQLGATRNRWAGSSCNTPSCHGSGRGRQPTAACCLRQTSATPSP